MIKLLHLSDIHLGSGFSHGRVNPQTGLNTRLEDFVQTLGRCIDRALAEPVDLVLFGGDAFPDATPLPLVQEAFAREFCRLVAAQIPTVLLVGNHDQHAQGQGGASLCIYRTLGVPGFIVGDRLETHRIETRNGPVQVITLPWVTRSMLLTRPETEGLSLAAVNQLLIDRLRVALEGEIRSLDPDVPTVLLGHLMVDTARYGAERFLAVGKGFTVPLSLLTRDCFDYVALGHVHRHQVLCQSPWVVYPGSIERVDFSEEKEAKGFMLVTLARRQTQAQFCPLPVRRFLTIQVDLASAEDPQATLLAAIAPDQVQDAVVRLVYQLRPEQLSAIDNRTLHDALALAHSYTIQPELVSQWTRSRVPELGVGVNIDPLDALKAYLDSRPDLQELAPDLLTTAAAMLAANDDADRPTEPAEQPVTVAAGIPPEPDPLPSRGPAIAPPLPQADCYSGQDTQLRLL
ncbi:exonuclease subunit SbcD [Trichothermofontia sichuanensis B231]|uniref:exonuclease subunit SbcD n=1 Tax=Trichothermofontia sichuanensis TaxID=3045816 RepID=UPI0022464D2C|nr:exonuclease subunit SbcD [Trichothermofontia sichuanensis]UZQ55519.1 exonuclease subunit SbcD [Trichothermofontia sichuanensis B231]